MLHTRLSLFLILLLAVACSDSAAPPELAPLGNGNPSVANPVEATAARPNVTVRNTSDSTVGYFVVEREILIRATFAPCGDHTPRLAPGRQIVIPYDSIMGYDRQAKEAVVFWCTMSRGPDGLWRPVGGMQSVSVRL
ncbi:MAG: hypothetical protein IT353_10555 [Gemmatimonadaceae bacterium]|nr:hypothetical protein [Gemmatimonadaceae bacterium]